MLEVPICETQADPQSDEIPTDPRPDESSMDFFIPGVIEPKKCAIPAEQQSDDASREFKISSNTKPSKKDESQTNLKLRKVGRLDGRKFARAKFHGELLGVDFFKSKN